MDVAGQRILILGLAREGESLARFLAERGAQITVTDAASRDRLAERIRRLRDLPVDIVVGGHHPELVTGADRFFVSPGVPESSPVYEAARRAGLIVESMTTLFFARCPAPIVGVTGSSGKTTTTSLIGHVLRTAGRDVTVAGNIGSPMLDALASLAPGGLAILELSSFQLELLRRSPHIAVVTNISPNHLDRHGTMERYVAAKRHILEHQGPDDWAVLNAGDSVVAGMATTSPGRVRWFGDDTARDGAAVQAGVLALRRGDRFEPVMPVNEIPLLGAHNVENVLAATTVCDLLGVDPATIASAVRSFRPPEHRLQTVGQRRGVTYVDDSIATSPTRAIVALRAIDQPVLLIAGGRDKNLPWEEFALVVAERVRALFLIGEAAPCIEEAVRGAIGSAGATLQEDHIHRCATLADSVRAASAEARPGDVVLLSPACTSYDMFNDFAERGSAFAHTVEELHAA
ncbi:MAG TPA: UDP-N-acetylmuramoyl-L-alanine--D-glutamate ligase [Chloroflexota bacterium]|nr:UDP-N-acetylmuramoyl-L-alanine--D-glutamate ligase [Chloroflexota bacterium]